MYVICDLAMHIILQKSNNYDVRDFSSDARIPSMYYQVQPDSYQNVKNYIPEVYLPYSSNTANATKKTGIVVPVSDLRRRTLIHFQMLVQVVEACLF